MRNIEMRLHIRLLTISKIHIIIFMLSCFSSLASDRSVILSDYEKKIKNNSSLKSAVDKLSQRDLEKMLRHFVSDSRPNRVVGTLGSQKAHQHIENFLNAHKSTNVSVSRQDFSFIHHDKKLKAANFIWKKQGATSEKERLILLAHFDTVLKKDGVKIIKGEMQGADNNASSIALLFGMIALLNELDLPRTIEIVFIDAHEWGDEGLKHYLSASEFNSQLDFVLNLSKLGHDSKKEDKQKKFNNISLYLSSESTKQEQVFGERFIKLARDNYPQLMISLKQRSKIHNEDPIDTLWAKKIPGAMLSQDRENDLNPRLYSSNDFVETLNFDTLFFIYKALANSVLALNYDIVK